MIAPLLSPAAARYRKSPSSAPNQPPQPTAKDRHMPRPTHRTLPRLAAPLLAIAIAAFPLAPHANALDEEHRELARELINNAVTYLLNQQHESGGWSVPAENANRPHLPAITALALTGIIQQPDIGPEAPNIERAVDYIFTHQQPDGGFYDRILAAYNTALTVSAFSKINTPRTANAIPPAVDFLKSLQWHENAGNNRRDVQRVSRSHPFYGGVGYGGSSRPDNSNLNLFLQALHDAGVPAEDPAYQRALVFLSRTQMLDKVNDMPYADGSTQGGFIYATSPSGQNLGVGESKAGRIIETLTDGTEVSRLRAYGSMTYAGFKSMIYANLTPDDERVQAALGWIKDNYTLQENPGIGNDGLYYYYLTFARALDALGVSEIEAAAERVTVSATPVNREFADNDPPVQYTITTVHADDGRAFDLNADIATGTVGPQASNNSLNHSRGTTADGRRWRLTDVQTHHNAHDQNGTRTNTFELRATLTIYDNTNWQNDLIARLAQLQQPDGSFQVVDDRWMEDNPVLITAYTLIALQAAID